MSDRYIPNWIKNLSVKLFGQARRRSRLPQSGGKSRFPGTAMRPQLEMLEDRVVPTTWTVNSSADPGTGSGTSGSLRYALENVANGDTVTFASNLTNATIHLTPATGGLTIDKNITITGPGGGLLISSYANVRIFTIAQGVTASISSLTIAEGASASGGGILNDGTLSLSNAEIVGCTSTSGGGGAIDNIGGTILINNCDLEGNTAPTGGAIYCNGGSLTVANSDFAANQATTGDGGAIATNSAAFLYNTTFANNIATAGDGGGIASSGPALAIASSTFAGNSAVAGGGGGIDFESSTLSASLINSIVDGNYVTGNTSTPNDILGNLNTTESAYNIIGSGPTNAASLNSTNTLNVPVSSVDLGVISSNGGPTQTLALMTGSVAIGAGSPNLTTVTTENSDNSFSVNDSTYLTPGMTITLGGQQMDITAVNGAVVTVDVTSLTSGIAGENVSLATDQRGHTRGNDVGAYEFLTVSTLPTITPNVTDSPDSSTTLTISGTNFSTMPANDSVSFNLGVVGTVTASNANQLLVTITTPPTALGDLMAVVTVGSQNSAAEQVATEVSGNWVVTDPAGSGGNLHDVTLPYAASVAQNGDEISFASNLSGDIITLTDPLSINNNLTITGLGAQNLAISGDNEHEILASSSGITATISNLTLENGSSTVGGAFYDTGETFTFSNVDFIHNSAAFGGALGNEGTLTLTNCLFENNFASEFGGAIEQTGSVTLFNDTLANNTASDGGAIFCEGPTTAADSLICDNSASEGGAIEVYGTTATLTNDTLAGNTASNVGGAIYNFFGTLTVSNVTIAYNTAQNGGGIDIGQVSGGTSVVNVLNSIVADNAAAAAGPDINGIVHAAAYDVVDDDSGLTITLEQNFQLANPELASALADNGGPTETIALQSTSPAIGSGGPLTFIQPVVATDTTITVSDAQDLASTNGDFYILVDSEVMLVTAVDLTTNVLTVQRGVDGTTPANHGLTGQTGVYLATDQRGFIRSALPDIGAYQVNAQQVMSGAPTVSDNNADLPDSSATITIDGTNFSTTPANNTVTFNLGVVGTVTASNSSQLLVTITTPPTALGDLMAVVAVNSQTTAATQVATEVNADWIVTDPAGSGGSLADMTLPYAAAKTLNGDQITFANTLSGDTISLSSGISIGRNITITGLGAENLTIQGHHSASIFDIVYEGATVTISGLTIEDGQATQGGGVANHGANVTLADDAIIDNIGSSSGGGVFNTGTMTITNCVIEGNSAAVGAGVFNSQFMTLTNDTVSDNSAQSFAGGIYNDNLLTATNSLISGNSAHKSAGGIQNYLGTLTLANDTITGNSAATGKGGGIETSNSSLTLSNDTVAYNAAPTGGGINIESFQTIVTLLDTLVDGNNAESGPDIDGTIFGGADNNLIGDVSGLMISDSASNTGNLNGENTGLATSLADNGGPTQTLGLHSGSPAIGSGGALTVIATGESVGLSDTTINVTNAAAIAVTAGNYLIVVDQEEMLVTGVDLTNNVLTVQRGFDGTTPADHEAMAGVYLATDQRGIARSTPPDIGAFQHTGVIVNVNTGALSTTATSLTIYGSAFDSTASNDTVTFDNGVSGTVTTATSTSLVVSLTGLGSLTAGTALDATVTVLGSSNSSPVQVATVDTAVVISPSTLPNSTVGQSYSQSFTISGGVSPYTFALTSGAVPTGLTLNTMTGSLTGMPTTAATFNFTVTATDSLGLADSNSYAIVINPVPTITTTLPDTTVNQPYSQTIVVTGGTNPDSFAVTIGSLPTGLSLNSSTGAITGTPSTTTGSPFSFTITATDATGAMASHSYSLTVNGSLTITTTTLPIGTVNQPYSQNINVTGGTNPDTFAVTSGSLPAGLSLNPGTGAITGTPSSNGVFSLTITATDAAGATANQPFSITINAPLAFRTTSLPNWTINRPYAQTITVTGGTGSYLFAVTAGSLPAGLTLNTSTGAIAGTPSTTSGSPFMFTITATDTMGTTGSRSYSVIINATPTIAAAPASSTFINLEYYQPIHVLNGTAPFTLSLTSGSLPAGVSFNSSLGAIAGAPTTTAGSPYTFTIEATDAAGATASQTFSLSVAGYSVFMVTNTSGSQAVTGSLPWAVNKANLSSSLSYIDFDIPGSGTHVITISSSLFVNNQTVIDGTTQPGYAGIPLISVQGTSAVPGLFIFNANPALGTTSSGSTLQGLDLYSYTVNAVTILSVSQGDYIQNDYIGFYKDSSGAAHLNATLFSPAGGHETNGIALMSSYDTIRGNTISGNYIGLNVGENPSLAWSGTAYYSSGVLDNNIGTDPTGTTSGGYGNLANAIFLGSGAQGNFLGPYNVLSGNGTDGVAFDAPSVTENVLFSNVIGTDVTGKRSIPNGWALAALGGGAGVLIDNGAFGNCIGGPFGGNFISGNGGAGVVIGNATGNFCQFNIIGLNGSQTGVVGSQSVGVSLSDVASGNVVTFNVIAGMTSDGVAVNAALGNNISNNWLGENVFGVFFADGGFGVDLSAGSNNNFVTRNHIGSAFLGVYYVSPLAVGNDIV